MTPDNTHNQRGLVPTERRALQKGLSNRFLNMSYEAIARELSGEFGREIKGRQIRHYVASISRPPEPPKPRPIKYHVGICNELRALTGMSERELHRRLERIKSRLVRTGESEEFQVISRPAFQAWLKQSQGPLPKYRAKQPKKEILKRCRIHLHAVHFEVTAGFHYLICLTGYEEATDYLQCWLIDALLENTERPKVNGRPMKMPEGPPEITIVQTESGCHASLSANLVRAFALNMADQLRLPVTRLCLQQSIGQQDLIDTLKAKPEPESAHLDISYMEIEQCKEARKQYLPVKLPPDIKLDDLTEAISTDLLAHQAEYAQAKVNTLRADLAVLWNESMDRKGFAPAIKVENRNALTEYYPDGLPSFKKPPSKLCHRYSALASGEKFTLPPPIF